MTKLRRLLSVLVGFSVYLGVPQAHAGIAAVLSCSSCQTTTDFTNAALSQYWSDYGGQYYPTTYQVVSNSSPMTAYISVYGGYIWLQEPTTGTWYQYWIQTGGYPVDQAGNALGGDETTLENYYVAVDEIFAQTDRSAPILTAATPSNPMPPVPSFIGSDDDVVGSWIDQQWGSITSALRNGDVWEVDFRDGTVGLYQLTKITLSTGQVVRFWSWIKGWNRLGQQIDKNGNLVPQPNQNPQSPPGGGTNAPIQYAQLGPSLDGNQYGWQLQSAGACVTQTSISVNGQVDSTGTFWVPCP